MTKTTFLTLLLSKESKRSTWLPRKGVDIESYGFADYVADVKPMLMEKLEGSVGEVGESAVRAWDPMPMPLARLAKETPIKTASRVERPTT